MPRIFRSTTTDPFGRGKEFGNAHAAEIRKNIALYQDLFLTRGAKGDVTALFGQQSLAATKLFAPELHAEMLGMAEGANHDPVLIGMLNARTEILAVLKAQTRGECSVVIHVPTDTATPTAVQTWDWFYALRQSWLVWEIPLADGSVTKTMTEYGIVGKSGLNTKGLGLLFTILHHVDDGNKIGLPVHVAARWTLDNARNIAAAARALAKADTSASSSLNLVSHVKGISSAMSVELCPGGPGLVLPDDRGVLVHTNHFLAPNLQHFDTEPKAYPDTLSRHTLLLRKMAALSTVDVQSVMSIMADHSGGDTAVCCHHKSETPAAEQYETLATVVLDVVAGQLTVRAGGPCTFHKT